MAEKSNTSNPKVSKNQVAFLDSIKTKLIAIMVAVSAVPLIVAVIVSYVTSTDKAMTDALSLLDSNAKLVEAEFASIVEQNVIAQLIAQAAAPKISGTTLNGDWASANDINDIADDIIEMQSAFDDNDWGFELNGLFLNKKQINAIRKGYDYKVSHYDVDNVKGYPVATSLTFADCIHTKSKFMDDGYAH